MASGATTVRRRLGLRRRTEESTAAGIYGTIVGAAVMAATHANRAFAVEIAVAVTLVIYWAAERYARLVAQRIHLHRRPSGREVREQLTLGWEMVTASILPLAVLAIVALAGARVAVAVLAGLVCSTVMLCVAGWEMGRGGDLGRWERAGLTAISGMFGVVMIVLKTTLH